MKAWWCLVVVSGTASLWAAEPPARVILDAQRAPTAGSLPGIGAAAGGQFYLVARKSLPAFSTGEWSLFRTDGTAAGTREIVSPQGYAPRVGPYQDPSALPLYQTPSTLAVLGNTVIFRGEGELWRTDGTPAGTFMVRDILAGFSVSVPDEFVTVGTNVFFSAHDGVNGRELWRTDGTSNGTVMVRDIRPGSAGSIPMGLTRAGNLLYFVADSGPGPRVWVSDGTSNGTVQVGNFQPGGINRRSPLDYTTIQTVYQMVPEGNRVMFHSTTTSTSFPLTLLSGSIPASITITQVMPAGYGSFGQNGLIRSGGGRFFFRQHPYLWSTDGTSANTAQYDATIETLLEDFQWHSNAVYGTRVVLFTNGYFYMGPGRADGTPTGSVRVSSFYTDEVDFAGHAEDWYSHGSVLFYTARPNSNEWALCRVDGTNSTVLRTFPEARSPDDLRMLGSLGGILFLAAPGGQPGDVELWRTDGSVEGTRLVADLNLELARPTPIFGDAASNRAFYLTYNAASNPVPIRTSGRPTSFFTYSAVSNASDMIRVGDKLFALGLDRVPSAATNRLFVFPVAGGAPTIIPVGGGSSSFADGTFIGSLGARAFFSVYMAGGQGYVVWSSDGTAPGTLPLWDVSTGGGFEEATLYGYPVGGRLVFRSGYDSTNGLELIASDGTAGGTYRVVDLNPGVADGAPTLNQDRGGAVLGGHLYFRGNNGNTNIGAELWRTDGTLAGTTLVGDVRPGGASSSPSNMERMGGHVYFSAIGTGVGRELWRTDGASVELVRDIRPGSSGSLIDLPRSIGTKLLFFATDSTDAPALWASDGTSNGTYRVLDIKPAPAYDILPEGGWAAGGWYFFTCDDGVHGRELWASDGTSSNTFLVEDTSPGPASTEYTHVESAGAFLLCQLARRVEGVLVREVRAIWPDAGGGGVTLPGLRVVDAVETTSGTTLVDPPYRAVSLAWTNLATNFVVEASDHLPDPAAWRAILAKPSVSGAQLVATNYTVDGVRYYRLRRYE